MRETIINWLIKGLKVDANKISDGYHTFGELYEHRCILYLKLCEISSDAWCSLKHSDGSSWDGWFILGIGKRKGSQITYHLPLKYWTSIGRKIKVLKKAPKYDGHTPSDVLERLSKLNPTKERQPWLKCY